MCGGTRIITRCRCGIRGSIPACAGEPSSSNSTESTSRVYPRVCGGTSTLNRALARIPGLSPRVRGNHGRATGTDGAPGSIPACAGEPGPKVVPSGQRVGSIPACAGEPVPLRVLADRYWVYPRVCGGTRNRTPRFGTNRGLSPRVRGNLTLHNRVETSDGSIPACAGEPRDKGMASTAVGVYPRVCGGTARRPRYVITASGLSPRVRGNRYTGGRGGGPSGSIPACAGEPKFCKKARYWFWVYPRVCGGTSTS